MTGARRTQTLALAAAGVAAALAVAAAVSELATSSDDPMGALPGLAWSSSPDRLDVRALDGATLDGSAHVHLVALDAHVSAEFWLDGRLVRTDDEAPFDLVGGDAAAAEPLVAGALRPGTHQLEVLATTVTGGREAFVAFFEVVEPSGGFDPMAYRWAWQVGPVGDEADFASMDTTRYFTSDVFLQRVTVPLGVRLTSQGSLLHVEDAVLVGDLRAEERFAASHLVLERCRSTADGKTAFGTSIVVRDCDITGDNDGLSMQSGPNGTLFDSELVQDSLVEYNWLHGPGGQVGTNHQDGVQLWQGRDLTIRRNWIDGWHTSAILLKTDFERITNVRIEENYLEGSGYFALYVRDGGHGRPTWVTITDNVFGRASTPISAGPDPSSQATFVRTEAERLAAWEAGDLEAATWIVWSGNVWADTGEEIVPPGGWLEVTPTDPTDPTDPTTPTEPTDPTEPVEPTDPTEPTDEPSPTDKPKGKDRDRTDKPGKGGGGGGGGGRTGGPQAG